MEKVILPFRYIDATTVKHGQNAIIINFIRMIHFQDFVCSLQFKSSEYAICNFLFCELVDCTTLGGRADILKAFEVEDNSDGVIFDLFLVCVDDNCFSGIGDGAKTCIRSITKERGEMGVTDSRSRQGRLTCENMLVNESHSLQ
jgi:hypothetical protein